MLSLRPSRSRTDRTPTSSAAGAISRSPAIACRATRAPGADLSPAASDCRRRSGPSIRPTSPATGDRRRAAGLPAQFYRALHKGGTTTGHRLYPAMPYPHFTVMSRRRQRCDPGVPENGPASALRPPANRLPFPLDIRLGMIGWNMLNFSPHGFKADPARVGAVEPRCLSRARPRPLRRLPHGQDGLGAEKNGEALQGVGDRGLRYAPDLTGNPRTGLGRWSVGDIVEYLRTGRNGMPTRSGQMAEVVNIRLRCCPIRDLKAIATYLKSLPPARTVPAAARRRRHARRLTRSSSTHAPPAIWSAKGQPRMFPPLRGSAVAQQSDPTGLIGLILGGGPHGANTRSVRASRPCRASHGS